MLSKNRPNVERFLQFNSRRYGDLGGGRTHNLQLRRLTLYPIELRDRDRDSSIHTPTRQAGKTRDRRSASTGGLIFGGRGERIRTSDLSVPNAALYQAEPRPDKVGTWCRRWESNPHGVAPNGF